MFQPSLLTLTMTKTMTSILLRAPLPWSARWHHGYILDQKFKNCHFQLHDIHPGRQCGSPGLHKMTHWATRSIGVLQIFNFSLASFKHNKIKAKVTVQWYTSTSGIKTYLYPPSGLQRLRSQSSQSLDARTTLLNFLEQVLN